MDNLTESMRNACLDGELPEPGQLLFEPQADSGLPKIALDNLPRYLFRIATRESDGETNEVWVRSESALSKHRDGSPPLEDIFHYLDDEKRKVIARTLNFHLRWWPKRGKRGVEDNFVSWTSSLLFAIQYIYYRHLEAKKMSKLEDIKLYVIDTTLFHRGTFLRDMDLIDAFCEFDDHRNEKNLKSFQSMRNKPEYYFGEYLSQGSLKIQDKCQVIPATVLFENGRLNRLQPHFADIRSLGTGVTVNWAKEVVRLREAIWPAIAPHDLSASDLVKRFQAAREIICHHVAPAWRLPLAIYFTALIGTTSAKLEHEENADDSTFFAHFHSFPFPGESMAHPPYNDTVSEQSCLRGSLNETRDENLRDQRCRTGNNA